MTGPSRAGRIAGSPASGRARKPSIAQRRFASCQVIARCVRLELIGCVRNVEQFQTSRKSKIRKLKTNEESNIE